MHSPPSDAPIPINVVSYHAVMRFVQRVKGIILPETGNAFLDAETHAAAVGMSIDQIRLLILTPQVQAAIRVGCSSIRTPDYIVLMGGGVVTTILSLEQRPKRKPEKFLSRKEARKAKQAFHRKKTKKQKHLGGARNGSR